MNKQVKAAILAELKNRPDGYSSADVRAAKRAHRNGLLRVPQPKPTISKRQARIRGWGYKAKRSGLPFIGMAVWPPRRDDGLTRRRDTMKTGRGAIVGFKKFKSRTPFKVGVIPSLVSNPFIR